MDLGGSGTVMQVLLRCQSLLSVAVFASFTHFMMFMFKTYDIFISGVIEYHIVYVGVCYCSHTLCAAESVPKPSKQ